MDLELIVYDRDLISSMIDFLLVHFFRYQRPKIFEWLNCHHREGSPPYDCDGC